MLHGEILEPYHATDIAKEYINSAMQELELELERKIAEFEEKTGLVVEDIIADHISDPTPAPRVQITYRRY